MNIDECEIWLKEFNKYNNEYIQKHTSNPSFKGFNASATGENVKKSQINFWICKVCKISRLDYVWEQSVSLW